MPPDPLDGLCFNTTSSPKTKKRNYMKPVYPLCLCAGDFYRSVWQPSSSINSPPPPSLVQQLNLDLASTLLTLGTHAHKGYGSQFACFFLFLRYLEIVAFYMMYKELTGLLVDWLVGSYQQVNYIKFTSLHATSHSGCMCRI